MKVKRLTAAILAAAITVSSIAPEAFAEIGGAGGTSTVNESTVDTSTDLASVGSDKTEEPGKTVSASEPGEGESDYTYNALDDGTIEITGYSGSAENIVIPAQIDGKSVTRIGNNAFEKSSAKEIVIPDSVTEIGSQAFSGCGKLTGVSIPNSVTTIRDRAFFDCNSLASITIPDSVTDIELQAFCNCTSLKSVTIPASVTDIGDEAFGYYFNDIDELEIKKVDGFKINYVKNTYGHYYATKNGFSDEDCLFTNELNDGTLEISKYVGNSATYEIPGEIDGKKVIRIGNSAFIDCTELTSVTIPDGVTDIRWRAFYNCVSLKSVTIPKSVIDIDNYAFGYYYDSDSFGTKKIDGFKINYVKNTYGHMYAIKNGFTDEACLLTNELDDGTLEITKYVGNSATCVIPSEIDGKKVTQIGYNAFSSRAELTSITIPDGVTIIGNSAFSYCTSLETVTIPNSVTQIYTRAFYNCTSLKEVTIPASVTDIGDEAFGYYYDRDSWKEKKVDGFKINYVNNTRGHWYAIKNGFTDGTCFVVNELDDGTAEITGYAGNSATCVIPDEIHGKKVTRIGNSAFKDRTELTSVTIPDGVTYIVDCAFFGCTSLETVTIPNSVINICSSAFYNCTSLKEVTIPASVTYIGDEAFGYYSDIDGSEIKKVDGFKINYVKNTYGHYYATKNGFSDEDCLFTNELNDGTLEISKYVGNSATYEIPGEIDGKKVIRIGNSAFIDCTELTSVTIPDGVTDIRWRAFYNCVSLKSVTIPKSVIDIDNYAFGYYYDSDSFGTKKIDGFKINYVKNTYGHMYAIKNGFTDEACLLTNELDDGTLEITKYVGNSATCVIPSEIDGKKVTQIGYNAFSSRAELTSITIPDGVTIIGNSAFSDCTSLETVTIPNSVTHIYPRAFYNCTSLKEVAIPASVTVIRDEAFGYYYDTDSSETKKADGFKINYVNNTQGHWYAIKNGFTDGACFVVNELGDGTVEITGYAGNSATCVIPDEIDGKKVTEIGDSAFKGCTELTSITIPDGVIGIGNNAFSGCTSLETVTIPASVTYVGNSAFYGCTSLKSVTVPESVTYIGGYAFAECYSLKYADIPANVTGIGASPFYNCRSLENINTDEANKWYTTVDGVLYDKDKTELINYPAGKKDSSYVIPEGIRTIREKAFYGCLNLCELTIPDSVTEIESGAFECSSLISDEYGTIKYVDGWVVGSGHTANVVLKDGTRGIAFEAFSGDGIIEKVTMPDTVKYINGCAFENCTNLSEVLLSSSLENIERGAFLNCSNLADIVIPDSVISITSDAFYNTALLNKQNTPVKYAGKWVITAEDCDKIVIKDGTKCIASYAFSSCTSLTDITIPDSVTMIGDYAFATCNSLTEIKIPNNVKSIGGCVFWFCGSLKNVTIPDSVTMIGDKAFFGCTSLTDITIPGSVTMIGNAAFVGCKSLTDITISDGVTMIGNKAFSGCTSLTDITIPGSVTMIGNAAFSSCTSLTDITIPGSVTMIGNAAFSSCTSLTDITIPDSVTSIGGSAFYNCPKLLDVTIPDSVTNIGDYAFGFDENDEKIDGFKIYCYGGTAGEQYAKDNGFEYKILECKVHKFGEWTITEEASCTKDGEKVRVCSLCNKTETETIPATGHTEVIDKAVAATCTKTGLTEGIHCSVCNAVIKAQETVPAKGHKYVDTVVKPTYTAKGYTLHKCSVCGESYKDTYTAKLTLAKVTGVKLGGRAADALRINWTKNTSADGYIVEMYQGNKWVRVAKITNNGTTTFRKAGLSASTVYKFRVKAYKMEGKTAVYSEYSATVAARTNPSVMTGAKLTGRAADALRINWSKNASADGYIVEMYQGNKWVRVAKITNNSTTTFRKAGLKASSVYKFRVRAYKMSGSTALYGNYSATVAARTNPSVMTGAKLTGRAADALRINWSKNASADGYIVEMYQGNKWVRVAKITSNGTTTYRASGLSASTVYKFRVRAYKMSGKTALYGNYSATVTARTNPSVMTGVKIGGKAKDALRVNWTKNASAQGYIVEMYKGGKWVRVAKITNGNTTTFRKAGLAKNTAYKFRVCAYYMSGKTALYGGYGSVSGKTAAK